MELYKLLATIYFDIVGFYMLLGIIGYLFYKPKKSDVKADCELVIISKANKEMLPMLKENIKWHSTLFKKPYLVIDEGSELEEEIEELDVNLVIVPKGFKTKAIAKGRAMDYFVENYVDMNNWYAFIDDDNLILDDKFLYEIEANKDKALANPVLVPRPGKSKIAWICDSIRELDDNTIFRFTTGFLKKPINGLHGELLIANAITLRSIGFTRKSITEDFAFSQACMKEWASKSWQSETKVSILSPNSIKDLWKQRKRWYVGLSSDVWRAHWITKLFVIPRLITWKLGIFFSWAFVFIWWGADISPIGILGAMCYIFYYLKYIWKVGFRYILLLPLYSVIELASAWYPYDKNKFSVIDKSV